MTIDIALKFDIQTLPNGQIIPLVIPTTKVDFDLENCYLDAFGNFWAILGNIINYQFKLFLMPLVEEAL